MNQKSINSFIKVRQQIYASINGTKGNLVKLIKSNALSKKEKELLSDVIDKMELLRIEYYNNRGNS